MEDNDDAREMMRHMFLLGGHAVREAADGVAGLALALERPPDVAIIDIGLPELDGFEFARRLRADPRGRDVTLSRSPATGTARLAPAPSRPASMPFW